MKLELGMGNGAKKPVKYPTKRTVNLAKRESHSQSVMTLSIGTAVIIVLVVLVVKFGVLDQLARQSAAESAYNTVHAQYTEMQSAVEKYPEVEEEYRTYSRKWMQQEGSGAFVSVDRPGSARPHGELSAALRYYKGRHHFGRRDDCFHVRHESAGDFRYV